MPGSIGCVQDGVLEMKLPRAEETKPKKIDITVK
jgi:HSP20 family molecular chaperone IbpA